MNCPKCGNKNIRKRGKRAGKQRYACLDCGACFTEGVKYKRAVTVDITGVICPKCKSTLIIGDGKFADGRQKYKCKSCLITFNKNTVIKEDKPKQKCPYCGSLLNYSGYNKFDAPEYYCPTCKKSCTGDIKTGKPIKRVVFKEHNTNVLCPHCSSTNIRKTGIVRDRQRYICNNCEKSFIENPSFKVHSKEEKEQVILEILKGKSISEVAKKYGFSEHRIRTLTRPYCEKEKLTEKQKNLIITYGYYFKVPVEYLAEYVPCSRRTCRAALNNYSATITKKEIKAMSTNLDAVIKSLSKTYYNSSAQK